LADIEVPVPQSDPLVGHMEMYPLEPTKPVEEVRALAQDAKKICDDKLDQAEKFLEDVLTEINQLAHDEAMPARSLFDNLLGAVKRLKAQK